MTSASRQYHAQAVLAASPVELIDKLYGIGIAAAHRGDAPHVRSVLTELVTALDEERGGELATRLRDLYEYALRESATGNLEPTISVLTGLRETWREAFLTPAAAA